MRHLAAITIFSLLATAGLVRAAAAQTVHQNAAGYTPQRVFNVRDKKFSDFEAMLSDLASSDVVFIGEQHDDPATHRLERMVLEGLSRRRSRIVVSMEMFERDVQQIVGDYIAGRISEEEFLKASRPWPRYKTDYRPIVEFARAHGWKVVASNTPRRLASLVSRQGLGALDTLQPLERSYVAAQIQCPFDDYHKRFAETMSSHPGSDNKDSRDNKGAEKVDKEELRKKEEQQKAMIDKFYFAQCVKDETMAESIAAEIPAQGGGPLVVHYNGAFHSDYRLGTAMRASRRLPKSRVRVVTVIPVEDIDRINTDEHKKKGDYILYTLKPAKAPEQPPAAGK